MALYPTFKKPLPKNPWQFIHNVDRPSQGQYLHLKGPGKGMTLPEFQALGAPKKRNVIQTTNRFIRANKPPPPKPPDPGPLPAPELPATQAQRQAADRDLTIAEASGKSGLYNAALRYGDPDVVAQYGQVPEAGMPISELSTIGRDEDRARLNLIEGRNQANTFFSGGLLRDQGRISDQVGFERAGALQRYQDAEDRLTKALAEARSSHQSAYDQARATEIEEALKKPPEPKSPPKKVKPPPNRLKSGKKKITKLREKRSKTKKGPEKQALTKQIKHTKKGLQRVRKRRRYEKKYWTPA